MKIKAYAKINLTLDIVGELNGFHQLNTLVNTIDVFDVISVSKRKDDKIVLKMAGKKIDCDTQNNNAYKSAKLFKDTFSTSGANIKIKKNIPIGGGLGGSSADIAGVLVALKKLFKVKEDIIPLANMLGSDSGFMVNGGCAVLKGRGEKITKIKGRKLYLIIITENIPVVTKDCYKKYDKLNNPQKPCTKEAVKELLKGNMQEFCKTLKNDLYLPAISLLPKIKDNILMLEKIGAKKALMTGSGSSTYGIFLDKKSRDKAYKILGKRKNIIKAQTIE